MIGKFVPAVAMAVALLSTDFGFAQVSVAEKLAPDQPPVIGVTGRMRDVGYPEDSMAGFKWALDRGIDLVVVRVQVTGDGQYIVFNEGTLARRTNVRDVFPDGAPRRESGDPAARMHIVADYLLDEIKRLRFVDPQGGDHPVPTLVEALDLIGDRMLILLSLEGYEVDSLAALLETRDKQNLLLFDEGDPLKLQGITAATGIGVWGSVFDSNDPMRALDARVERFGSDLIVVDVEHDQLDTGLVAKAERLGVLLSHRGFAWEDPALREGDADPWMEAFDGPAAIYLTEYPDTVLNLLGR